MKVRVILYSTLRETLPPENNGRTELELPDGCTLGKVVERLNLSGVFLCAVNKVIERDMMAPLHNDDELRIFRPGSGGIDEPYKAT